MKKSKQRIRDTQEKLNICAKLLQRDINAKFVFFVAQNDDGTFSTYHLNPSPDLHRSYTEAVFCATFSTNNLIKFITDGKIEVALRDTETGEILNIDLNQCGDVTARS